MEGRMQDAAVVQHLLSLMATEGVVLTEDLGQCELAILNWVRSKGAAMLQAHLGGKKAGLRGFEPGVRMPKGSAVRATSPADPGDLVGPDRHPPGVLPLSGLRDERRAVRRGGRAGV